MRLLGRGWEKSLTGAYEEPPALPVGHFLCPVAWDGRPSAGKRGWLLQQGERKGDGYRKDERRAGRRRAQARQGLCLAISISLTLSGLEEYRSLMRGLEVPLSLLC